jgi:hypothetical protein
MENFDFIEIESYEGGRWIMRRYPRQVAVNLFQQLAEALGAHEYSLPEQSLEGRLKVHVE